MNNKIASQDIRVTSDCSVLSTNETNMFRWDDVGILLSRNYTVWNLTVSDMTKVCATYMHTHIYTYTHVAVATYIYNVA